MRLAAVALARRPMHVGTQLDEPRKRVRDSARTRQLALQEGFRLLYLVHIERRGKDLFEKIRALDLEGIVAKRKDGPYDTRRPRWIKIKNPHYSQAAGRHELFHPRRR